MKKIIIGLFAMGALLQLGCSRTSDVIGPDACPSSSFAVTTNLVVQNNADNSTTVLDLTNSYASITAAFNETITYTFSITGQTSGAVFKLDGKSNALTYNWYGNSTNGTYFRPGETVSYKLTNLCKTEPLGTGSITLATGAIGYSGFGLKMISFDDNPAVSASYYGAPHTIMNSSSSGYVASPQGGNYVNFTATNVALTWYFGGMDLNGFASKFPTLGTDPTKVYLNFFAKGMANSQAQMLIKENAYGTTLTRKFLANVGPDWKLYSVRLSDIGIINPSAINAFSFNMGAALHMDTNASVDLDLIIFTFDQPF